MRQFVEHGEPFIVERKRRGKPSHRALRLARRGAFDQRRDDGQLNDALAPVGVDNDARDLLECHGRESVGDDLSLVNARHALDQRALCFRETTVCAGNAAEGAQDDVELFGCEYSEVHGPEPLHPPRQQEMARKADLGAVRRTAVRGHRTPVPPRCRRSKGRWSSARCMRC